MLDAYMYHSLPGYPFGYPHAGPSKFSPTHAHARPNTVSSGHAPTIPISSNGPAGTISAPTSNPTYNSNSRRPKLPKKGHSSNTTKQRTVQASLEAKVEKCRGWNAFFVPLARGMPNAPPSSPVLGAAMPMSENQRGTNVNAYTGASSQHIEHYGNYEEDRQRAGSLPASIAGSDMTHLSDLSRESTRTLVDPPEFALGPGVDYFAFNAKLQGLHGHGMVQGQGQGQRQGNGVGMGKPIKTVGEEWVENVGNVGDDGMDVDL